MSPLYILPALWFADLSCPFCGSRIYPARSVVRGFILPVLWFADFVGHCIFILSGTCLRRRENNSEHSALQNMKFLHCLLFCAIFAFLNPPTQMNPDLLFYQPAFVSACFILSEHLCLNAVPYAACLYHLLYPHHFAESGSRPGLYLVRKDS
jgi:hypothetical protein